MVRSLSRTFQPYRYPGNGIYYLQYREILQLYIRTVIAYSDITSQPTTVLYSIGLQASAPRSLALHEGDDSKLLLSMSDSTMTTGLKTVSSAFRCFRKQPYWGLILASICRSDSHTKYSYS